MLVFDRTELLATHLVCRLGESFDELLLRGDLLAVDYRPVVSEDLHTRLVVKLLRVIILVRVCRPTWP